MPASVDGLAITVDVLGCFNSLCRLNNVDTFYKKNYSKCIHCLNMTKGNDYANDN